MRPKKQIVSYSCYLISVLTALMVCCPDALAAETTKDWRPLFDLIMRWLNFAIIAFVLVKFGRKPIKDFLANRSEEIAYQIKKYEQQKEAAAEKVKEATKTLSDSTDRFEQVKQRIIKDGETRKQQIIEKAQQESRMLLEELARGFPIYVSRRTSPDNNHAVLIVGAVAHATACPTANSASTGSTPGERSSSGVEIRLED